METLPRRVDRVVIGAGLYGLYAALRSAQQGCSVALIECEDAAFTRATYVNQARVHMGYHYPRSYSTAVKTAGYFRRFCDDFPECIMDDFEQVYATAANHSWTDDVQFQRFCDAAGIPCRRVTTDRYFRPDRCSGAFITREYTYDARILRDRLLADVEQAGGVTTVYGCHIASIERGATEYELVTDKGTCSAPFVLNATYASVNELAAMAGFEPFPIKYERCEIILCRATGQLADRGITVMDGPFFSIMPFGKTGYHSLTSVSFTPHDVSYDALPTFPCQGDCEGCTPQHLANCDGCEARPHTAWPYMSSLAKRFLNDEYGFEYDSSLFSMKPILVRSELDDSRPTIVRTHAQDPTFVSVLSGKIDTIYDLDEVLAHE